MKCKNSSISSFLFNGNDFCLKHTNVQDRSSQEKKSMDIELESAVVRDFNHFPSFRGLLKEEISAPADDNCRKGRWNFKIK